MRAIYKTEKSSEGYFESLPKSTQEIVRDLLLEVAKDRNGPEGYKYDKECIEEIECRSRDGFIAFASNRGGLTYQNFTDLMGYFGGGYQVAHKKAQAEIERQIEYGLECANETFFTDNKEQLEKLGFTQKSVSYHALYDAGHGGLAERLSEYEHENLSGDDSSIMHEFRFLYHGVNEAGEHEASVSAAINTEGPYHRSSISWAPGVFCEGAKEIEITWKTETQLKARLEKALKNCSKEIF
jgi:hypothetical protein